MAKLGKPRSVVLWAVLGLTLAAALWFKDEPNSALVEEVARPTERGEAKTQGPPAPEIVLALPERRSNLDPAEDAFLGRSWTLPPAPVKPAQTTAPSPPPLPFIYLGRMEQDGQTVVFLAKQDRSYVVKAGEVVGDTYRLDEVKAGALEFTYLPLKIRQTLQIREAN
jgi:hypothetical protein